MNDSERETVGLEPVSLVAVGCAPCRIVACCEWPCGDLSEMALRVESRLRVKHGGRVDVWGTPEAFC